mgnify:CR=1 FL=1
MSQHACTALRGSWAEGAAITAGDTGYVQSISFGPLATLAKASGVCITLDCRTGDFVRRFAFEF